MLTRALRISLLGSTGLLVVAACGSSKSQGSEGGACYGNGTCDAGLICSKGETCVSPGGGVGGSSNGAGGSSNIPSVDLKACFACGDEACPSQKQACDDAPGCQELLGCTVGCGDDIACKSQCSAGNLTQEELVAAAAAMSGYTLCSTLACLSECSAKIDGVGGGSPGTGGGSASGGAGNSTGGRSSGGVGNSTGGRSSGGAGNSTGGDPGTSGLLIFDGAGVGVGSEEFGIDGGFYILEDSVADGDLVEDPTYHTDLDPTDSSVEPSTFELSAYPCIEGTVAQVVDADGAICETNSEDCDWGAYWGGGIGLSLKIVEEVASAWDADAAEVAGFRFGLSGSIGGAPLRFMVEDTDGNQFCVDDIPVSSGVEVEFSDLEHECWSPTNRRFDPTKIKSISWQFVPNASESFSIGDFCVDSLSVVQ